jgi:hypothetical protein
MCGVDVTLNTRCTGVDQLGSSRVPQFMMLGRKLWACRTSYIYIHGPKNVAHYNQVYRESCARTNLIPWRDG